MGYANDRSKLNKQIRFETSILQSDLCDYNDAYIVVEETVAVTDPNDDAYDKKAAFKKCTIYFLHNEN